jgi:hypothetical protein
MARVQSILDDKEDLQPDNHLAPANPFNLPTQKQVNDNTNNNIQ